MSDNRWRRDPMGRPYDPYRGFDERGRAGGAVQDERGYDHAGRNRGAADPGYRPDAFEQRDHATDQYRAEDRGQLRGGWDWERARRGEVEGDYGRGYDTRETGAYRRDDVHRGRDDRDQLDRAQENRAQENRAQQERAQQERARRDRSWTGR